MSYSARSPGTGTMTSPTYRRSPWLLLGIAVLAGCESLPFAGEQLPESDVVAARSASPSPKRPGKYWTRISQYAFCSDFTLNPDDPLFRELEQLPETIQNELELPPSNAVIQVYLFETQDQYEAYLTQKYPRLPIRRAYFFAEPRAGGGNDLLVYTWMGEHLRTDLRHELTHAILNGVLKTVPIWLDEGLAGFFELPASQDGVNDIHLEVLRKGPFQPDLARLEKLGKVEHMEKPEYREAWAWVHFMLRSSPEAKQALIQYLKQLQTQPNPGPFLPRLKDAIGDPACALAEHLSRVTIAHSP